MNIKNIIKTIILGNLLYSAALMQASQEYAKVLFDVPDQNLAICAHYTVGNLGPNTYFTIKLYESQANNLKNSKIVGSITGNSDKKNNSAYISVLYIAHKERKKNYGRILAHLLLQEFANQGFKKVTFMPAQIDTVPTETLKSLYSAGGASKPKKHPTFMGKIFSSSTRRPLPKDDTMEFDISKYQKTTETAFDKEVLYDVTYHTNLLKAAQANDLPQVITIVNEGVSPDVTNLDGVTPLMYAAIAGNIGMMKYLITQAHANVNIENKFGSSLLTYMIRNKNYTPKDFQEILGISTFNPEIKNSAATYAHQRNRPDIAEVIENYHKQKSKL